MFARSRSSQPRPSQGLLAALLYAAIVALLPTLRATAADGGPTPLGWTICREAAGRDNNTFSRATGDW